MNKRLIEAFGWYGAFALLFAFTLGSFSFLKTDSVTYQLLNLSGALGIVAVSLLNKAYPPALLNAVWAIVAFVALVRVFF